jgi:hypothetical protein
MASTSIFYTPERALHAVDSRLGNLADVQQRFHPNVHKHAIALNSRHIAIHEVSYPILGCDLLKTELPESG